MTKLMIISGDIDEIRFRNEDNAYTIIVIDCGGEPIVAAGNFPPLTEGEHVKLSGTFVVHPKFGKQFKAEKLAKTAPNSQDAILRYLSSGIIKGVGPKTALAIVSTFGLSSLNIIEFNPDALSSIRGISKNKALEISQDFRDNKETQEAIMFLQERNISLNLSLKIYKRYGKNTIAAVSGNPYRLIEEVDGIGFSTADKIASEMGIGSDSAFRIRAIILYSLKQSTDKFGNTYLPKDVLVDEVTKLCSCSQELILQYINDLVIDRKLKYIDASEGEAVMPRMTYHAERGVAVKLIKIKELMASDFYECNHDIDEFERINNLEFHETQRAAIECAINSGVSIITGGPGTGKTTILKCLLYISQKLRFNPMLMAPTGRAAKRLLESTGFEASTIHRALMINVDNPNARASKINANIVVVDEFSMVDIFLFHNLLSHLSEGTKLVIVGDKDQLPSVGAGNCLKDLLDSGLFPSINLTKIFRQSNNSHISLNAHAINRGEMPRLLTDSSSDFFFLKCSDQNIMASKIVELYSERIPKFLNVEPSKIQVLCPLKNGIVGSNSLNYSLQEIINPQKFRSFVPSHKNYPKSNNNEKFVPKTGIEVFRVGDKVMHITNNYNLQWTRQLGYSIECGEGIFNGDMGKITKIDIEVGSLEVELEDGRLVTYTPDIVEQLTLAYAITVHKSQGSEFDAVIMPITLGSPVIMTRNLLYTAITRARRMVVLVGDEYSIRRMVENSYIAKRYSALKQFLCEIKNDMKLLFDNNFEEC